MDLLAWALLLLAFAVVASAAARTVVAYTAPPPAAHPEADVVPWRKNVLALFGAAYAFCAVMYAADVWAVKYIAGTYESHAAVIVEAVKMLTIGVIAVAKDLIK